MEKLKSKTGERISIVYNELDKMFNIPLHEIDKVIELLGSIAITAMKEAHEGVTEILNTKQS